MSNATFFSTPVVDHFISLVSIFESNLDSLLKPTENAITTILPNVFGSPYENLAQYFVTSASPFASRLPLMNFFHVIVIMLTYLGLVFGGKAYMENKEKFNMRPVSIFHNLFLVLLSTYMCGTILSEAWRQGYGVFGNPAVNTEKGWQVSRFRT
jgi:hypothetical protein